MTEHNTKPSTNHNTEKNARVIRPASFQPTAAAEKKAGIFVRPIHMVIVVVLAVAITIGWFLISARSLVVNTQPADAEVSLSGGIHFSIGSNFLLMPGQYQISAEHPEFYSREEPVTVTEQDLQNLQLTLDPLPGKLQVITQPQTSAQVFIDEQLMGDNQSIIDEVPAGEHAYLIASERYQDARGEITIAGRRQLQQLEVTLTPNWAEITLDSQPSGAAITLEGVTLASTPATVEVIAGDRELALSKPGYKTKIYPLTVTAEQPQQLGTLQLDKIDGQIAIASKPNGASVTINGQYVGQTPVTTPVEPGNSIAVYLFKDGYQSASRSLDVRSGQSIDLDIDLQVLLGQVTVNANPSDALLYIDGRLSGRANQTLQLPAKQHQIKISRDGHVDFTTTVLPRPGFAQHLSPKLKTLEQAKWEKIKPRIVANGQSLKLFKPNQQFQMGSSRREQGRRANEALHSVKLNRAFYLAEHETTNQQFRQFMREHSSSHVSGNSLDNDSHPVVNVSWLQAARYCNWLSEQENLPPFYQIADGKLTGFDPQSHGYRLPTEAEWAWAARFNNGQMLKYTWGDTLPPPANSDNIGDRKAASLLGTIQASYDDGYAVTAPVGQFKANHNGLFDINGNAAEWVHDFYIIKTGLSSKAELDPLGPTEGDFHVIRGGSWASGGISDLRLSYRDYGTDAKNTVGFRIARYVQ